MKNSYQKNMNKEFNNQKKNYCNNNNSMKSQSHNNNNHNNNSCNNNNCNNNNSNNNNNNFNNNNYINNYIKVFPSLNKLYNSHKVIFHNNNMNIIIITDKVKVRSCNYFLRRKTIIVHIIVLQKKINQKINILELI